MICKHQYCKGKNKRGKSILEKYQLYTILGGDYKNSTIKIQKKCRKNNELLPLFQIIINKKNNNRFSSFLRISR